MNKVLLIISSSNFGGGTKHIKEINNYVSDKIDFYLAAPSNFLNLKNNKFLKINKSTFSIIDIFKLRNFIKKSSIKVVHSHGRGAALIVRTTKLFLFSILHFYTLHGVHLTFKNSFIKAVYIIYERFFSKLDHSRIFVSDSEKSYYERIWRVSKHNIVIYNCITETNNLINKTPKFDVGVLTRLHHQKNLQEFLLIAKNCYKLNFIIAGSGPEDKVLREFTNNHRINNVTFFGYCEDKRFFFNNIKLYLSTSLWEGLPYSVLESISYDTPLLLKKVVGHVDFKIKNTGAILYDDVCEASSIILKLFSNKQYYYKKVQELTLLKEKFSPLQFKQNLLKLYLLKS